jgi:hypothetical protein
MRFRQGNEPIKALAPDGADDTFANRIGLWTSWRRFQHGDAEICNRLVQVRGKDIVAVVKQVLIPAYQSNRLAQLLQSPSRGRMGRDIEMDQAPAVVLNDHEYIQEAKRRGDDDKEIARDDPFGV